MNLGNIILLQLLLYKIRYATQPVTELIEEFSTIQVKVHAVYQEAPQTTDKAVEKADAALKEKKDDTYTDEDMLLPESLRRTTPSE